QVGEVVGEVERRARAVRAMDDGDRRARQVPALVELLDRRGIPLGDLSQIDLRQYRAGHSQVLDIQVVDRAGRRERPGNLYACGASRVELRERCIARAEVDLLLGDGGDASRGADPVVVERDSQV